jgi:type I restriction enzyme R subunit
MFCQRLMSTQALGAERVRAGIKDTLLGPTQLWESLRAVANAGSQGGATILA